eukprot:2796364-Prymnesium_polylepis.1
MQHTRNNPIRAAEPEVVAFCGGANRKIEAHTTTREVAPRAPGLHGHHNKTRTLALGRPAWPHKLIIISPARREQLQATQAAGCQSSPTGREVVARVQPALDVPRPHAQHPLVLVRVVVHVNHHRQRRGRRLARKVARALGEEESLRVDPHIVLHHAHAHLGAIVLAVRQHEELRVEHLLVPACAAREGVRDPLQQVHRLERRPEEGAAHVEREVLHVEPARTPSHLGLVHGADGAARPRLREAVGRRLDVRVAVEVLERVLEEVEARVRVRVRVGVRLRLRLRLRLGARLGVRLRLRVVVWVEGSKSECEGCARLEEDEVEVDDEARVAHQQHLLEQAVLERRDH